MLVYFFFFFQAEDGIRDRNVTGVQTCALPISLRDAVEGRPRLTFPEPTPLVCPSDEEIAELAKLLNGARRVTIFGGAGCAGAHAELMEVARRLNAPVVHSL